MADWMVLNGQTTRPLLKEIIDEVLEDILGVRLREEILPLDRFAQTERVEGRLEVSVNSRIGEMAKVKNVAGVTYAAKWHEAVHVVKDFAVETSNDGQPSLPLFSVEPPQLVACRGSAQAQSAEERAREAFAENAGTAAAICAFDLVTCADYLELMDLADAGGELGRNGWRLLYNSADFIGINATVLARYWEQRGLLHVEPGGRLVAHSAMRGFGNGR